MSSTITETKRANGTMSNSRISITKERDADFVFKIVLVGNSSAGKTSLLLRYTDDTFSNAFIATIGVDFKIRTVQTKCDTLTKLQLWDTAGQDRFKHLVSSFYRNADAIVVVFDITDLKSFQAVQGWVEEARRVRDIDECFLTIIGNKSDLRDQRVVCKEDAQELAEFLKATYIETSAKSAENVHDAFTNMAHKLANSKLQERLRNPPPPGGKVTIRGKPCEVSPAASSCLC